MKKGTLHLLPHPMGSEVISHIIPHDVVELTKKIQFFATENIKTCRRYLKKLDRNININERTFWVFDKKSEVQDTEPIINALKSGNDVAIISEAGCPGIADPGSILVREAHKHQIPVKPHVGPTSILLTLIGSGLNGQSFTFHGYAPIDKHEKSQWIKHLWSISSKTGATQLFMETPYRNNQLLEVILQSLPEDALLCIGSQLTTDKESIFTLPIKEWKKRKLNYHKEPTIFAIGRAT